MAGENGGMPHNANEGDRNIREDFVLFRDLIKEENGLFQSRMTAMGASQAFLWAAAVVLVH